MSGKAEGSGQGTAAFEGEAVAGRGSRLNVELLRKVRDAIADEKNPTGFDMAEWLESVNLDDEEWWNSTPRYGDCGTVACIAGHTAGICGADPFDHDDVIGAHLGLDPSDATYLFFGHWSDNALGEITRAEAVAYLDHCIAAGEIVR